MKNFTDRIWLVLLGIAVAVLVTLTTIVWNDPISRTGATRPAATQSSPRATLPKIAIKLVQFLGTSVIGEK